MLAEGAEGERCDGARKNLGISLESYSLFECRRVGRYDHPQHNTSSIHPGSRSNNLQKPYSLYLSSG